MGVVGLVGVAMGLVVAVLLRAEPTTQEDLVLLLKTNSTALDLPKHVRLVRIHQGTCGNPIEDLDLLINTMMDKGPKAVVVSYPTEHCDLIQKIALLKKRKLVTWECPPEATSLDHGLVLTVQPKLITTVAALVNVFKHLKFRSASVISNDFGWWPQLGILLENGLMRANITVKHQIRLRRTEEGFQKKLQPLKVAPGRVITVLVDSGSVGAVLEAVWSLGVVKLPGTALLLVHLSPLPVFTHPCSLPWIPHHCYHHDFLFGPNRDKLAPFRTSLLLLTLNTNTTLWNTVEPLQIDLQAENVMRLLNLSLNVIESRHLEGSKSLIPSLANGYVVWDWVENKTGDNSSCMQGFWRPIIRQTKQAVPNSEKLNVDSLLANSREWAKMKLSNFTEFNNSTDPCEDDECIGDNYGIFSNAVNIGILVVCSIALVVIASVGASILRRQYLKSRMSKGPCKIILTPADFVFPQTQEVKRVEEGIEAMLCCWLHQLQELGGPEIDKPDLLKGSVGSLKSNLKNSPSLGSASKVSSDPRARYNGDLVQLKQIPSYGGSFELRSRAMDHLITLHSLRHENINPMIGCLPDAGRPLLVWEYCSRGSLEDVLMADEIKLDWSFRLSLLTDLVRGMRYLHASAVKVHGNLTSRNCVIDARWVLKITDYALPNFYDSQNISQPQKKPRDLLWTAPELLRNPSLRKTGTQPGDVYSFSIIMQEVVVRGEPYCTVSLPPEEILEKIKKPPPLIRPSVSKGAAPPEAINIMRQCWAELPEMRPDFNTIHDQFKTLNHGRKANFVDTMFQMLEKYSNNLEDLIRERTEQLDMEKKKTEQLLNRMLPSYVAEKLKLGMPVDPEAFSEVTIYFSDIVGFTTISAYSTPFEVVDLLNDLYTCFDATINAYNVYKVETIGDAYMVVGGLPVRIPDHAEQVATMALDLLHHSGKFRIRHLPFTPLRLRIGLHTGPCCAGVVGLTMPRYCLFGDTVNTASRMESSGSAWRIHISDPTKCKLEEAGGYQIECRGVTELKGKGQVTTYWLLGKTGFEKQLPTPPPLRESHGLDEQLVKYGRTGVYQLPNPGEESLPTEIVVDGTQSLSNNLEKSKPAGPVYQLSLDAALLASGSEIGKKSEKQKWKANRQMTFDSTDDQKSEAKKSPDVKSNISDNSRSGVSTPFSVSEMNVDVLGVSFVNQSKSVQNLNGKSRKVVDENDLSSQFNHYRCISPIDGSHKAGNSRFLKRQYSIDREDVSEGKNARLCKQNSAGAAHDLGRIDEVPSSLASPKFKQNSSYKHRNIPTTVSVESLN